MGHLTIILIWVSGNLYHIHPYRSSILLFQGSPWNIYTRYIIYIHQATQHKITTLFYRFYSSICPSLLHHIILNHWFSCTYSYHLSKRLDHTIRTRIQLKVGLEARGSKLMPDKMEHSFGFSCDGPGRGGTCDISAWDSFYLATHG